MRRYLITEFQLCVFAIITAVITAVLIGGFIVYLDYNKLPVVHRDATGQCTKVMNFDNGHAFNCGDVDVILRQYRRHDEKVPSPDMHNVQEKH